MQTFDWIVIGAGITGAALAYELATQGFSVLLLERDAVPRGATRYSYGGVAYWAGNTELTRTICAESLMIHQNLSAQLEFDTQFRSIDLLLTIEPDQNGDAIVADFDQFSIQPQRLTPQQAQQLEPLLNCNAIAEALLMPHAHIEPQLTAQAYRSAMQRLGGQTLITEVLTVSSEKVTTTQGVFVGSQIAICAGATTRAILEKMGVLVPQYFSYAESIETAAAVDLQLRTIVMPAITQRFALEAVSSQLDQESRWQQPGQELVPAIMDAGALQFRDGHIRMGQISRTLSDWAAQIDPKESEALMRQQIGRILPEIAQLPGTWCCCKVAFSRDHLPIVGELPNCLGIHLFSGFSNPMALVPGIARRYAIALTGQPDELLRGLGVDRFFV